MSVDDIKQRVCASCGFALNGDYVRRNQSRLCLKCARVQPVPPPPERDRGFWGRFLGGVFVAAILVIVTYKVKPDWFTWLA